MSGFNKNSIVRCLDFAIISLIGLVCSRYILAGGRSFAEQHVQFSFLDFPIFIGEFLLIGCGLLFIGKLYLQGIRWERWHTLLALYFGFILIKAALGYMRWGPLALRDAAMFYYVAFAVMAFYCYRRDYFNRVTILVGYAALMSMSFHARFSDFWLLGQVALSLILARIYPERWGRWLMILGVVVTCPYRYFLETARTIILGNFLSVVFLIFMGIFFFDREIRKKILVIGGIIIVALGAYVFHFSGYLPAQTVFNWKKLYAHYLEVNKEIEDHRPRFNQRVIPETQIYNPDDRKDTGFNYALAGDIDLEELKIKKYDLKTNLPEQKALYPETSREVLEENHKSTTRKASSPTPVFRKDSGNKQRVEKIQNTDSQNIKTGVVDPLDDVDRGKKSLNVLNEGKSEKSQEDVTVEEVKMGNAVFRLLLWRDIFRDLMHYKPYVGFDFGRPFRSESLEIINAAVGEWGRDGWIAMHNSFLNIIYRAGILGVMFIMIFLSIFCYMAVIFARAKSIAGALLCSIILCWIVAANFAVVLELPYTAIPIWSLFGVTLALAREQLKKLSL